MEIYNGAFVLMVRDGVYKFFYWYRVDSGLRDGWRRVE